MLHAQTESRDGIVLTSTHHSEPLAKQSSWAVLGIEPRTSRTRSENHATRPNSQLLKNSQGNTQVDTICAASVLARVQYGGLVTLVHVFCMQWLFGLVV